MDRKISLMIRIGTYILAGVLFVALSLAKQEGAIHFEEGDVLWVFYVISQIVLLAAMVDLVTLRNRWRKADIAKSVAVDGRIAKIWYPFSYYNSKKVDVSFADTGRVRYKMLVQYEYNGKLYSQETGLMKVPHGQVSSPYEVGDFVQVYVNPENPERIVIPEYPQKNNA